MRYLTEMKSITVNKEILFKTEKEKILVKIFKNRRDIKRKT